MVAGSASLDAELQKLAKSVGLPVELVDEPDLSQRPRRASVPASSTWWWTARRQILVQNPISDY